MPLTDSSEKNNERDHDQLGGKVLVANDQKDVIELVGHNLEKEKVPNCIR